MQTECVRVELAQRSYDIPIGTDSLPELGPVAAGWWDAAFGSDSSSRKALLVTDSNVARFHATPAAESLQQAGWAVHTIEVPAGEETKCVHQLQRLWDNLVTIRADRTTTVIAVGGGVVGDLAGFAAATFARGIPFIQVPTTLLAQVDSSVGGKTGINHPQGKNLIGAFHQPLGVFVDTRTLDTLPERDYRSGLAEVVKYGLIMDDPFFQWMQQHVADLGARDAAAMRHIVRRSCELKAAVVAEDERETTGRRAILNYGHTFAHAFEALSDYSQLMHGEAVAIGMVCAARLAKLLGRVDSEYCRRQTALLADLNLPVTLPADCRFDPQDVLQRMRLDKKTVGDQLRFVLPDGPGHVEVVRDVPTDLVLQSLDAVSG